MAMPTSSGMATCNSVVVIQTLCMCEDKDQEPLNSMQSDFPPVAHEIFLLPVTEPRKRAFHTDHSGVR